ncbi:MAG: GNAT family N-acetyltransferase [Gammaproteobacteria bacterium]
MLKFKKLQPNAFKFYANQSVKKYAEYIFESKEVSSMEEALRVSREEVLPWVQEALTSKTHHFYRVKDGKNTTVGWIWFELVDEGNVSFLVYIFIEPEYRGRGYAGELLKFYEQESKKLGANQIVLFVFKINKSAIRLYEKSGYKVVDEVSSFEATEPTRYKMVKDLV